MPADPDLELQGLIITRLKADAAVIALVGNRVYDSVPQGAPFPYISYGPSNVIEEDATCINGATHYLQVDGWSRAPGFPEAKKIAGAVRDCLHDVEGLTLTDNALVMLEHYQTQIMRDPDGLTSHAVITLQAYVERP